ncbi:hypothetical protein EJ04DRAFT_570958 [Polyplosphaeria fusca]|uniref:Uncharacterized protein n=1 Tax=Polyplosphaeria fusca TaxID=682080 RepID=A0A9P4QJC6_9PLEO|nr:hypothetical protein EJ04DRAFT_570958 [Polyplosphaeria fusca]
MAALVLGIFLGGGVIAIPVVTGIAEGVAEQQKQNEEAANETRMIKFNMLVSCDSDDELADDIDNGILVMRHDKAWIVPRDAENKPIPPIEDMSPPLHAFAGFFIQYPDEDRLPPERGMVSTISEDPPVLNWLYIDRDTYAATYGNRTASIKHIVGVWDWTDDEKFITLDGWEGFVAMDESAVDGWKDTPWGKEGLRWALYFDIDDNGLKGRKRGRESFEVTLERRCQSEADQLKQMEEAEKKMQVKSRGDLKTQFTAPAAEQRRKAEREEKRQSD